MADEQWTIRIHTKGERNWVRTAQTLLEAFGMLASLEDSVGGDTIDDEVRGITISRGYRVVCDDCAKEYEGGKEA